jgi:predicted solute-binding protein
MATTVSLDTVEGNVTLNSDEMQAFTRRSTQILSEVEALNEDFKVLVQEMADATKLKKPKVSKYLKQRYTYKTKETKQLGELFSTLDDVVDN